MQSITVVRAGVLCLLALLVSCGGGGEGGGGGNSSGGGTPPPAVRTLFVATQPTSGIGGTTFTTQPVVHVRSNGVTDAADNTTIVTASLVAGNGAILMGTATATAVAGVATFTNLGVLSGGGDYQLQFAAPTLTAVTSNAFNVAAPPPVRTLAVTRQPQGGAPAGPFTTQPMVEIRSNGTLVTSENTAVVTAAILAGPTGATLNGTVTATAAGGIATFTNLGVSIAGNYQLRFTATGATEGTSNTFAVVGSGPVIPPAVPPASNVTFSIDSTQDVRPISRFIYGLNGWNPAQRPKNLTLSRSGGNRMTAYNWENNASNAGNDYFNQNDGFLGGGTTPNGAVGPAIVSARNAGAGIVVTMPTIGYVAADKNSADKEDVNVTPNYLQTRFKVSRPRKGAAFVMAPDATDGFVNQDEYINFLAATYPGAFASASTPIFISLDNEPDLWHTTHARLRGDATRPPATQSGTNITYAEIVQRARDYANAAKDVNPNVTVFGPANYGWQGYVRLQGATDANNRDFLEFFLQQMAQAEVSDHRRVLDVLDVHWYPEAQGGGVRITGDDTTAAVVAARKQAPRSLWDTGYTETSWIAQSSTNGPIRLLPRLKEKITTYYPNTRLAITEYNYGAGGHISGGIAQADVLGIFGREGLFAANLWQLSPDNSFIYGAFEMFRDYDGVNGSFGDTNIRASNSDVAGASVYASVDAGNAGRMVVVAINKSDSAQTAGIAVTHTVQFHTARVYALTAGNSRPQHGTDIPITQTNAFQYSMPANSVTTLVLLP